MTCYGPVLADEENSLLEGNKNKTGLFNGVSYNIEEPGSDITLTEKQDVGDC